MIDYDGEEDDYKLIHISKQDVDNYRLAYLLRVLDMAEMDDIAKWLGTEEAITQGYDPKDGLRYNMAKYFMNLRSENEEINELADQEEMQALPDIPSIDPYWKKYQAEKAREDVVADFPALPEDGVLFLGGHINMVKRVRKHYPGWMYITDDEFKPYAAINVKYVFYWTNHSSHKMMEHVFGKLAPDAEIMYVTATNMERLEAEMLKAYTNVKTRKRRGSS